jgi:hypothetical protein
MLAKKSKKHGLIFRLAMAALVITFAMPVISLAFLALMPSPAHAFSLEVPIGNFGTNITFDQSTRPIADYVKAIYNYAIGAVGILAAVVLMIGGVMWITAGGDSGKISEARNMIFASLTGLVLALTSYLILSQISPALVNLKITAIKPITATKSSGETKVVGPSYSGCGWSGSNMEIMPDGSIYGGDSVCPEGKIEIGDKSNCSGEGKGKCCCLPLAWDQWAYQSGIDKQKKDASPDLQNLLNCMRGKLPNSVGEISSISDSAIAENGWNSCSINYKRPPCAHVKNSCHYGGGRQATQSYAVDFGDEQNSVKIIGAAKECGAKYVKLEGNHIHVSSPNCLQQEDY